MDYVNGLLRAGERMEYDPALLLKLAERYLRVRDRRGRLRPLRANAAQRMFEAQRGRQNIVLKARQMGMTTWVAARFFLRTITRPGTLTLQVAHTREAAEGIFRVVQRMWENLPVQMRDGPLQRRRANVGQMVFGAIDSEFRVASAYDGNAGRGLSVQNLHCSEVSRWPGDAAETLAGLRAALDPRGELVLESTPNGAYGAFYQEWLGGVDALPADEALVTQVPKCEGPGAPDFVVGAGGLVRHFMPWWMEPAYVREAVARESLSDDEVALMEREGLSLEQIGFRRELQRNYGRLRSQEFAEDAETCFRATGACCFELEAIERRLLEVPEPIERRRNGALLLWFEPQATRRYLVAVDTAGGGEDGDFAAIQVIDAATGLQCAELQERLRPAEQARVAAALAREYNGAMIVVERNNHGAAVHAFLNASERYRNIYRQRGEQGWWTSTASKPEMVARLGALLRESPEMFVSRRLLGECRTFVAGENGRASAANGAHDDLVMAMCVAQAVRAEGRG